jgi:hypothetical protein
MIDALEIPVSLDVPLYTQRVTLDGKEFLMRFDWNARDSRWRFDLGTIDEVWLACGVKIVCNVPLLRKFTSEAMPSGILIAVDFSPQGGESPVFADLGRRVKLMYYPVGSISLP